MSLRSTLNPLRLAMLAGAVGVIAAAAPAGAQDRYHEVVTGPDGTETVIVEAPYDRIHHYADGTATLSRAVSYSDLDLTTRDGAHELRARVRETARDVCAELRDDSPVAPVPEAQSCVEGAYKSAMLKADEAIRGARDDRYYEARYGHDGD